MPISMDRWPGCEDREYCGLKVTNLADVKPLDEETLRCCEAAYRRGFHQGVEAVLHALRDGISPETLAKWSEKKLHPWRYNRMPSYPMTRRDEAPPVPKGRS